MGSSFRSQLLAWHYTVLASDSQQRSPGSVRDRTRSLPSCTVSHSFYRRGLRLPTQVAARPGADALSILCMYTRVVRIKHWSICFKFNIYDPGDL